MAGVRKQKNTNNMRKTIYRNAITGKIVTKEYAEANPDTTEHETIEDNYVFIVQDCHTLVIHGVFDTKEKANKYTNEGFSILKAEVL